MIKATPPSSLVYITRKKKIKANWSCSFNNSERSMYILWFWNYVHTRQNCHRIILDQCISLYWCLTQYWIASSYTTVYRIVYVQWCFLKKITIWHCDCFRFTFVLNSREYIVICDLGTCFQQSKSYKNKNKNELWWTEVGLKKIEQNILKSTIMT